MIKIFLIIMGLLPLLAQGSGIDPTLIFKYSVDDDPNFVLNADVTNLDDQTSHGNDFINLGTTKFKYVDDLTHKLLQIPSGATANSGFKLNTGNPLTDVTKDLFFFFAVNPVYNSTAGLNFFYDVDQATPTDIRIIPAYVGTILAHEGIRNVAGSGWLNDVNPSADNVKGVRSFKFRIGETMKGYFNNTLLAIPGENYTGRVYGANSTMFCNNVGTGNFRGNIYEIRIYNGIMSDSKYTDIVNEMNIY